MQDPSAPPLWTRFYDLESSRPMFSDRDGKVYYTTTVGGQTWMRQNLGYDGSGTLRVTDIANAGTASAA